MTQVDRVLQMLQSAGETGVTNQDFYRSFLPRHGGRIYELRKSGHDIRVEFVRQGMFRYTLHGCDATPHPAISNDATPNPAIGLSASRTEGADLFEVIHGPYGTRIAPQGGKL